MCIDDLTKIQSKTSEDKQTTAKQLMEMQQESVMDSMLVCFTVTVFIVRDDDKTSYVNDLAQYHYTYE